MKLKLDVQSNQGKRMASQREISEHLCLESVIRGRHVYKCAWSPRVREQPVLRHEEDNCHDVRAVTIIKDNTVVGHMPFETAKTIWFFLRWGGSGVCEVAGRRMKGIGLEIQYVYTLSGPTS